MKGLKKYIKKHGKHFTEQLAYQAAGKRWSSKEVKEAAQKRVYYNVTGSTLGDMTYLANEVYDDENTSGYGKKSKCITYTLYIIGNYDYHNGVLFDKWLNEMSVVGVSFDFTPYI